MAGYTGLAYARGELSYLRVLIDVIGKVSNVTRFQPDKFPMENVKLSQELDGIILLQLDMEVLNKSEAAT
jgi:hypothetical protein